MSRRGKNTNRGSEVVVRSFRRDLRSRRSLPVELPEFLICALEARVAEANEGVSPNERATLSQYIETELANLVSLRDVAELDYRVPGFAEAVNEWLREIESAG